MWPLFLLSVFALITLVLLPGMLVSIGLGTKHASLTFSLAPAISFALYAAVGVSLGALGIYGGVATAMVIALPLLFGAGLAFLSAKRGNVRSLSGQWHEIKDDLPLLLLFVAVSAFVVTAFFLKSLDGPASYSQHSDNIAHLSHIIETAEDGNYSLFTTASYSLESMADGSAPIIGTGFYPNGFYILASFAVSLFGASAPLAENAAIFVFAGIVYPLACFGLMRSLFCNMRSTLLSGALATAAFASFPLALLTFGPLYPNMAAFCCVPAVVLSFILIFRSTGTKERAGAITVFVLCSLGTASLQPNAIFTSGVLLIPFCCHEIYVATKSRSRKASFTALSVAAFLAVVIIIWFFMVYSPLMRSVTSFNWAALDNPISGIYNVLTLSLRLRAEQVLLAIFVITGLARLLASDELRWVALSYLLMAFLYYLGNSFNSELKQLATGFWYTDQWRTAASVAIIGAPVAAAGISSLFDWLRSQCQRWGGSPSKTGFRAISALFITLILLIIFQPQRYLGNKESNSAFGSVSDSLDSLNHLGTLDGTNIYTEEEREFVTRAVQLMPEESLVINMPYDGSVYAHLDGSIDTYYKTTLNGGETEDSELIRLHLDELDRNIEVQHAVEQSGATYVLLLERNGFDDQGDSQWSLCASYRKADWTGISAEKLDEVNSLELVLQEGNMRLYRIII